jgi:hypothetical protein
VFNYVFSMCQSEISSTWYYNIVRMKSQADGERKIDLCGLSMVYDVFCVPCAMTI